MPFKKTALSLSLIIFMINPVFSSCNAMNDEFGEKPPVSIPHSGPSSAEFLDEERELDAEHGAIPKVLTVLVVGAAVGGIIWLYKYLTRPSSSTPSISTPSTSPLPTPPPPATVGLGTSLSPSDAAAAPATISNAHPMALDAQQLETQQRQLQQQAKELEERRVQVQSAFSGLQEVSRALAELLEAGSIVTTDGPHGTRVVIPLSGGQVFIAGVRTSLLRTSHRRTLAGAAFHSQATQVPTDRRSAITAELADLTASLLRASPHTTLPATAAAASADDLSTASADEIPTTNTAALLARVQTLCSTIGDYINGSPDLDVRRIRGTQELQYVAIQPDRTLVFGFGRIGSKMTADIFTHQDDKENTLSLDEQTRQLRATPAQRQLTAAPADRPHRPRASTPPPLSPNSRPLPETPRHRRSPSVPSSPTHSTHN